MLANVLRIERLTVRLMQLNHLVHRNESDVGFTALGPMSRCFEYYRCVYARIGLTLLHLTYNPSSVEVGHRGRKPLLSMGFVAKKLLQREPSVMAKSRSDMDYDKLYSRTVFD